MRETRADLRDKKAAQRSRQCPPPPRSHSTHMGPTPNGTAPHPRGSATSPGHAREHVVLPFLLNKPKQRTAKFKNVHFACTPSWGQRGPLRLGRNRHEEQAVLGRNGGLLWCSCPQGTHGQQAEDETRHRHGPPSRLTQAPGPGPVRCLRHEADVARVLSWWAPWGTPSDGSAHSATSRPGGATRASPLTAWSWASRRRPCTG